MVYTCPSCSYTNIIINKHLLVKVSPTPPFANCLPLLIGPKLYQKDKNIHRVVFDVTMATDFQVILIRLRLLIYASLAYTKSFLAPASG